MLYLLQQTALTDDRMSLMLIGCIHTKCYVVEQHHLYITIPNLPYSWLISLFRYVQSATWFISKMHRSYARKRMHGGQWHNGLFPHAQEHCSPQKQPKSFLFDNFKQYYCSFQHLIHKHGYYNGLCTMTNGTCFCNDKCHQTSVTTLITMGKFLYKLHTSFCFDCQKQIKISNSTKEFMFQAVP